MTNVLAVPLLAVSGHWSAAVALMIVERMGKAVRTPARDAMLSHATEATGRGWGFGLHEAMDQAGATIGPLIVAAVLFVRHDYRLAFGVLLVPALFCVATLLLARSQYPHPEQLEIKAAEIEGRGFPRRFWFYLAGSCLFGAGFADYPLIAFHLQKHGIVTAALIPVLYGAAMLLDGVAALSFGKLFDRIGIPAVALATFISAFFAPAAFLGGGGLAIVGIILWAVGLGAQESIMRAAIAEMVSPDRRATAYGVLNMAYGISWFLGSVTLGALYDRSVVALVAFSLVCQLIAIPLFLAGRGGRS